MMFDHYRRSMLQYFNVLDLEIIPHFSIKRKKLKSDNYKNPIQNFIKALYIVKNLNHVFTDRFLGNSKNEDIITDNAILYFTESRKELEKRFNKKLNFIVIIYDDCDIMHEDTLSSKLNKNGFKVILTKDLTNEDLGSEKYKDPYNFHPKEEAWDLLLPKLIKKMDL